MADEPRDPDVPADTPVRHFGRKTFGRVARPDDASQILDKPSLIPAGDFQTRRHAFRALTDIERRQEVQDRRAKRIARQAAIRKRRITAYEMWVRGASARQIGDALGVVWSTAARDIRLARAEADEGDLSPVADKRAWQWLLCKRVAMGLAPKATSGDWNAARELKGVLDHMSKLYGVFAPTKIASTTPDGESWAPISFGLSQLSTEDLRVLKKVAEMRLLPPAEDQVVEGSVVNE